MASHLQNELLVDAHGDRYFVVELPALAIFGRRYDDVIKASLDAAYEDITSEQRIAEAARRDEERLKQLSRGEQFVGRAVGWVFRKLFDAAVARAPEAIPRAPEPEAKLPAGHMKVLIGNRKEPTANQQALTHWLVTHQESLAIEVRRGIYDYYKSVYGEYRELLPSSPSARMDLPEVVNGNEIDDNMRVTAMALDSTESRIGIYLDCTWEDEHGMGVLIENFRVKEVGYADVAIIT